MRETAKHEERGKHGRELRTREGYKHDREG